MKAQASQATPVSATPIAPTNPRIMSVPVLSTRHIKPETAQYIHEHGHHALNAFAGYVGGWFFYVGEVGEMDVGGLPHDLRRVLSWAESSGHEWLRLDGAGDVISALPTFEWGDDCA